MEYAVIPIPFINKMLQKETDMSLVSPTSLMLIADYNELMTARGFAAEAKIGKSTAAKHLKNRHVWRTKPGQKVDAKLIKVIEFTDDDVDKTRTKGGQTPTSGGLKTDMNNNGPSTTTIISSTTSYINKIYIVSFDDIEQIPSENKSEPWKNMNISYEERIDFFLKSSKCEKLQELWVESYPLIDVAKELIAGKGWMLSNTHKTKRDFPRFYNNWMRRAQEKSQPRYLSNPIKKSVAKKAIVCPACSKSDDVVEGRIVNEGSGRKKYMFCRVCKKEWVVA